MPELHKETATRLLANLGFLEAKVFTLHHWAAIIQIGSFTAIVDGDADAFAAGYQNRWLYQSRAAAIAALRNWDGKGEPDDWKTRRLTKDISIWP